MLSKSELSYSFFIFKRTIRSSLGFPVSSVGKEYGYKVEDLGLIPALGRFPGEGKSYPLQYFGLENSMDCI